jgi:nitrate/TMAO reductase-like tetraheme cytochrome c subunit
MKEKTLEEVAERYYPIPINNTGSMFMPTTHESNNNFIQIGFIAGAKWQAERMYSDMQEYAEFCIECDRREMPLLLVQDWYEHFKKK